MQQGGPNREPVRLSIDHTLFKTSEPIGIFFGTLQVFILNTSQLYIKDIYNTTGGTSGRQLEWSGVSKVGASWLFVK